MRVSNRRQLAWPAVGIALGAAVSVNPFYAPHIPMSAGIAAWCIAMPLVLILAANPVGARIGSLLAGLFMAIPCFLWESPLTRFLTMGCMAAPVAAATAFAMVPPISGIRARLAYLATWGGTREVKRCPRNFDGTAFLQLIVAMAVLAATIAMIRAAAVHDLGLPVRWLAGGIAIMAFAEMVTAGLPLVASALGVSLPPLMLSPWRSASISEFWTRRWNIWTSRNLFHPFFFVPLAQFGVSRALLAAFAFSGLAHTLLAYMALGKWTISLICGAFFLLQPLLIVTEHRLGVRRWPTAAGRAWTLTVLAITSPLFTEAALQIVEGSWAATDNVLLPAAAALGFVLLVSGIVALGSLLGDSASHPQCERIAPPSVE